MSYKTNSKLYNHLHLVLKYRIDILKMTIILLDDQINIKTALKLKENVKIEILKLQVTELSQCELCDLEVVSNYIF